MAPLKFINSLSVRIIVILVIPLAVALAVTTYFSVRTQNDHLINAVQVSAERSSNFIKRALRYGMQNNQRSYIWKTTAEFGKEPGIDRIRIYDKQGVIRYSTDSSEAGATVDKAAEACAMCHGTGTEFTRTNSNQYVRVYMTPEGHRTLGFINPIRNERSCWDSDCHAHSNDQTFLGVLDIRMSLETIDTFVSGSTRFLLLSALVTLLIVVTVSGAFVYRGVHKPVKKVIEGTKVLASGNLAYEISVPSRDEVGELASSFNAMARDLNGARSELLHWSETLEQKVEEKTRELQETQAHIAHIEKMASLGKLSSMIAHELNNPLSGILTYAKLILKRLSDPDRAHERLDSSIKDITLIADEAKRCGEIVKNLLFFARGHEGTYKECDLCDTIEKSLRLVQHQIDLQQIEVQCNPPQVKQPVTCDQNQIHQVVLALIMNAIEAMPDGGILKISVSYSETFAFVRITDTGTGIALYDISKIFEPFYSTKEHGSGTGLGLSIAYGIIKHHGGDIAVQSEVGKGSTFIVSLPLHPTMEQRQSGTKS
jgi:two-component system, NtrC family, sensor kinase